MKNIVLVFLVFAVLLSGCAGDAGRGEPKQYRVRLSTGEEIVVTHGHCIPDNHQIVCWDDFGGYPDEPDAVYDALVFEKID